MTQKHRVTSAAATHFPNKEKVVVGDSEFEVENHQELQMLIDPEDFEAGRTHSGNDIAFKGARKVPTTAALHDKELPTGGKIAQIDNDVDPSAGYLEKEAGMPVINNASVEEEEFDDSPEFEDDEVHADADEEFLEDEADDVNAEFEDLPEMTAEFEDDAEMEPLEVESAEELPDPEAPAAFENESPAEAIALVDADEVAEDSEEQCHFATVANVIHVIRSNRIIASMGAATAKRAGMSDVYLSSQFQDVVANAIETKGLRKGLVQSGFVLAKVKLSASKSASKVIEAKVQSALNKKIEAMAKKEQALEQSLAIAAVGINRRFFKDTNNELKASLEVEFTRAGVRGASNIIRAMFAQHGVSYARSILTLANKISDLPEEIRNQYASALDLTNEDDFEPEAEAETEEDDFEEIPASVTAALSSPARRDVGVLLKAGVKTTAALSILSGDQALV